MKVRLIGGSFSGEVDLPDSTKPAELPDVLVCRSFADFPRNMVQIRREDYKIQDRNANPPVYKYG